MGVAAAMPRATKPTVFSRAGENALSFYLLHALVTPILHPFPWIYELLEVSRRALRQDRPVGIGFKAGNAVSHVVDDLMIIAYMVLLRVALSVVGSLMMRPLTLLTRLPSAIVSSDTRVFSKGVL